MGLVGTEDVKTMRASVVVVPHFDLGFTGGGYFGNQNWSTLQGKLPLDNMARAF